MNLSNQLCQNLLYLYFLKCSKNHVVDENRSQTEWMIKSLIIQRRLLKV